ncbi:MAG: Lpg0189 family type II secretion system effector [Legionella sp.]|uniref:Lpg0189 family type II secretion system effector n=1 Tax=Legionella sp. TaxID=459 RepID=UPI0039E3A22B
MKFNYLVTSLILLPLYAFSSSSEKVKTMSLVPNSQLENTQTFIYTNEPRNLKQLKSFNRSIDYPTQIIRMEANIEALQINCAVVNEQINKVLVANIATNQFAHAIYISCHYNPETFLATQFVINSYFDPLNDNAVAFLNSFLQEYNGTNFLGTQFNIESAKGLVISLSTAAGMKNKPGKPPFIEYRRDRSNFYFKNNYEMENTLFTDIYKNFYSNDPELVLPFLNKWVFAYAGALYKGILRDSNYTELQPERIFLMSSGEEVFVSGLKQYFMHHCNKYENHRCLKPA